MRASAERIQLGKRIRSLREKTGMSQEELGFKAKLHRTYIGSNVSMDNIAKLAKVFRISLSELFNSV